MEKIVDVTGRFEHELSEISYKLRQLQESRIYETTGCKSDGLLATNIIQLRNMLKDLFSKIQYGKPSDDEIIAELFSSK